jgi:hypothetical protein
MNGGWGQVEEIFHQALQRDPEHYESTLRKAGCTEHFRRSPWLPKRWNLWSAARRNEMRSLAAGASDNI